MVDEDEEFFHHGYQLLYTGNVQLALDDKLTVTVIDPTAIEVVMPAVSDAFLKNFDDYISIVKWRKKFLAQIRKAQLSAASKDVGLSSFDHSVHPWRGVC